jgi:hypothetical protein
MAIVRKALKSVRHAAHLFFRSQVKLELRGGARLAFVERDGSRSASPQELEVAQRRQELARMIGELAQCLDADPDIRPELRHLAYLETMLRQRGLEALQAVPLDVLEKALEQFEGLVSNWSPWGLAALRSKMAVGLAERRAAEATPSTASSVSRTTA